MSFQDPSADPSGRIGGTGGGPLSVEHLVILNDEIRALVRAGIPLDLGLRGMGSRSRGGLRRISESLAARLEMGVSIEEALGAEQQLPIAYRAILAAGLRTGRLDEVLTSLNELSESTASLQRQLRLSLIHPAIILVLAYTLFVAFVMYLVPQLQRTYEIFEIDESVWVASLLWLHRNVLVWGMALPAVVIVLLLVWGLSRRLLSGPRAGLLLGRWVPGGRDLALARFSRMLSLLVRHDVPLPEGCRLAGQAAGEGRIHWQAEQLAAAVEDGHPLWQAISQARYFPAFLCWLIAVGDRQGTLASALRQGAELHELQALTKLEWFRRIVPPLIVLGCCGTITLLYGLTLFLPLTELIRTLGLP